MKLVFKTISHTAYMEHPEVGEIGLEIADYDIENSGIGFYEYQGFRSFDRGIDYGVVTEISVREVNDEPFCLKKHGHIEKLVQDLWNNNKIEAEIENLEEE